MKLNNKSAFTIAEVLIAIGIVGVLTLLLIFVSFKCKCRMAEIK